MVSIEDLKRQLTLKGMTDEMLGKMLSITEPRLFKEKEIIYKPGQKADHFYMLKRGKVLLEDKVSESISISFVSIKPGYSFGWPSMLTDATYYSYAVSAEPAEVLAIPRDDLLALFDQDRSIGYLFMRNMAEVLVLRLEHRTEKLLKSITKHPDFIKLLDLEK
jgi:CRP-like cAMP-binding protein